MTTTEKLLLILAEGPPQVPSLTVPTYESHEPEEDLDENNPGWFW
jgi:hypothetical protein